MKILKILKNIAIYMQQNFQNNLRRTHEMAIFSFCQDFYYFIVTASQIYSNDQLQYLW